MIDYKKVEKGDILEITGAGAPRVAELGDLVRVVKVHKNSVNVEDRDGKPIEFFYNCGAARLKETEWKADFPIIDSIKQEINGTKQTSDREN